MSAVEFKKVNNLSRFGFSNQSGSVHTKRTMMLAELDSLMGHFGKKEVSHETYIDSIIVDNLLAKRSVSSRRYTANYLTNLYILDFSTPLYRSVHYLWFRDEISKPLLAFLLAYARDSLLKCSAGYILGLPIGVSPVKTDLEELIDSKYPGRFSIKMLQSLVRNLLSTWTQSGHLSGRTNKIRKRPDYGPGAVCYALFLGYLTGRRGISLFETDYIKLLDGPVEKYMDLAEESSRRGWIIFKRIQKVIDVSFPNFLTSSELESIREQN